MYQVTFVNGKSERINFCFYLIKLTFNKAGSFWRDIALYGCKNEKYRLDLSFSSGTYCQLDVPRIWFDL